MTKPIKKQQILLLLSNNKPGLYRIMAHIGNSLQVKKESLGNTLDLMKFHT